MGGRWRKHRTFISTDLTNFIGSGKRVRYCDSVDLRCFQVAGWRASVFPRRIVSTRTNRPRGRDALGGETLRSLDRHSVVVDSRHCETNHKVLLSADCREPERVEPFRI